MRYSATTVPNWADRWSTTSRGHGTRNMKELRPSSSSHAALRVLFAFDPERKAIMLIAGNKAGNWKGWYRTNIPMADDRFDEHLKHQREGR